MNLKIIKKFPDISTPTFNFSKWNNQFTESNVIINAFYDSAYFPDHWTPLSIKCAYGGAEYYIINSIRYGVENGKYLVLNNGTLYESYINSPEKVESFTISFTEEFVSGVFRSLSFSNDFLLSYPELSEKIPVNFFERLFRYNDTMSQLLFGIRTLVNQHITDYETINEKMYFLLEELFKTQFKAFRDTEKLNAKKRSTRIELYKRLNIARDYIYSNYSEKLELEDIALKSGLSPFHMLRKFKSHFGQTPHRYLTNRRIEKSRELIENSNLSITQVCLAVGYDSLSSFGELFKKFYKVSPEKYRILNRKKVNFQIA